MKYIILTIFFFSCSACGLISSFKIRDAMLEERIKQDKFLVEIPFEYIKGFIIIGLDIKSKKRNFIFDSGALTSIDRKIENDFIYKTVGKKKHIDSFGKPKNLKTILLSEISIGSVDFLSIVASIRNFDSLSKISCMDISGIIGSNIMNKAVWQIDYNRQIITLADRRGKLHIPENSSVVNFEAYGKGTPVLKIALNNTDIGEVSLDTGSNGSISLTDSDLEKFSVMPTFIERYSRITTLHNEYISTIKISQFSSIKLGYSHNFKNAIVGFEKDLDLGLIGNKFLDNYLVTIDWPSQQLYLSNYIEDDQYLYNTFGIAVKYDTDKGINVGAILKCSSAYEQGIRINDKIININQIDYTNSSIDDYCHILFNGISDENEIEVSLERNEERVNYRLIKDNYLHLLKND